MHTTTTIHTKNYTNAFSNRDGIANPSKIIAFIFFSSNKKKRVSCTEFSAVRKRKASFFFIILFPLPATPMGLGSDREIQENKQRRRQEQGEKINKQQKTKGAYRARAKQKKQRGRCECMTLVRSLFLPPSSRQTDRQGSEESLMMMMIRFTKIM